MVLHYSGGGVNWCAELVECVDADGVVYLVDQNDVPIILESMSLIDLLSEVGREQVLNGTRKGRDDEIKLNAGCSPASL